PDPRNRVPRATASLGQCSLRRRSKGRRVFKVSVCVLHIRVEALGRASFARLTGLRQGRGAHGYTVSTNGRAGADFGTPPSPSILEPRLTGHEIAPNGYCFA